MIDLDRISKLTGFVDKLIQLKGIEDALDEEKISELIQDAINYSHADYSGEEIEAATEATRRICIFVKNKF